MTLPVLFLAGLAVMRTGFSTEVMMLWLLAAAVLAGLAGPGRAASDGFDRLLTAFQERRRPASSPSWRWSVERPWRRYLFCLFLSAILLAVLPAVSLLNLAFDQQMDTLVQKTQLELAGRLEERERRLAKDLGERFPAPVQAGTPAEAGVSEGSGVPGPWLPAGQARHRRRPLRGPERGLPRPGRGSRPFPGPPRGAALGVARVAPRVDPAGTTMPPCSSTPASATREENGQGEPPRLLLLPRALAGEGGHPRGRLLATPDARPWLTAAAVSPAALPAAAEHTVPEPQVSRPRKVSDAQEIC